MNEAAYLICYDITDPKRLVKVHAYLKERALAVQYSVFAGVFTPAGAERTARGVRALIDAAEDDVRIYPAPRTAQVFTAGCGGLEHVLLGAGKLAPFLRNALRGTPDLETLRESDKDRNS